MKNVIAIAFLLIFGMADSLSGQINLDFSAGLNYSNCKFVNFEGFSPKGRPGYFFGLAPNYQIGEKVLIQIDFQYSSKGYTENLSHSSYSFGYLDIMPEIEYKLSKLISLGLGANFGIKLNERYKLEDKDWTTSEVETIKSTDFGLTGKFKVNYENVFGFFRYNVGLNDISALTYTDAEGRDVGLKQFNRNLQIGIGYKFKLRKN